MHFLLAFLFVSVRIALAIEGSFDPVHETACEYQDASLTWSNTTTNSAHNVKTRLWYKGNTTMARWQKGDGFEEFPPYIGRLMQIGENGIKIREANRSDSGTYLLIWKIEYEKNTSASVTNLQVIVPPTTLCVPNITREGDTLRAILPLKGCGIPRLTPNWMSGTHKLISDRISVLDLKSGPKPEVYIACAVGHSTRCMQVDSSNLCVNYTEPQPQNESDTGLILWWIPVLIIIIIIIIITVAILLYWITNQKKLFVSTDTGQTVDETNVETPLMNIPTTELDQTGRTAPDERLLEKDTTPIIATQGTSTAGEDSTYIIKLRDDLIKAYRNLRCVQVSPIFEEERRDIDNIYVDLVIEGKQGSRNTEKERKYVSAHRKDAQVIKVNSYKQIFLRETGSKFERVFLCGKGGLGKTTFCRKVLHAWCKAHEVRAVAKDGPFQDETVLKMFDLLFYLNLREVTVEEKTLIDVICKQFPLEEVLSESILRTLLKRNGDKVLFILDGLDEMIVKAGFIEDVVTRRVYPNCCFLISSRPWKIHEGPEMDLLLDLQGFSEQNAINCAENLFENCYKDGNAIQQFTEDIAVNKLATQLLHVPLFLLFLAHVWYENERSLPSKLHELYICFLNLMADRLMEKYKKGHTHKQKRFTLGDTQSLLPSKISETSLVVNFGEGFLLSLCEVAHDFLLSSEKENSLVFEKTKLQKALGNRGEEKLDVALDLGILSVTDSVSYLNIKTSVSFLHKTMQEFFTALYFILNPYKLANFISSIADLNDVQQNENIIIFLVGLMPKLGNSVLVKVNELYSDEMLRIGRAQKGYSNIIPYFRLYHVNTVYLRCKEEVIGEDVLLNVSHLCLGIYDFDLHTFSSAYLQSLDLMGFSFPCNGDYVLDLRGLTGLSYLRLHSSNCELYLPESGSLSVIFMERVTLSSGCCDVLGSTLTHCTKLERLRIHGTDLHNCLLHLSNMTELTDLDMNEVTLSSSCCDVLGRTLKHCTKLETLKIHKTDLHNCVLDLSNKTELRTMSSSCCDVLGSTLTHCTKLETLKIHKTDLHNCLLDLSNMTELRILDMNEVTLSSSCCDVLGRTLQHCTKLETLKIHETDLNSCLLDLSNMTELTGLYINQVTLSSSCCDVLGRTLAYCTKLESLWISTTDFYNCQLDFSNMTELTELGMYDVRLSSSCCDVLFSKLKHCTKLEGLGIHQTDLCNCLLDLSNMTELTDLDMYKVTLSSSCCEVLGRTLTHCTKLKRLTISSTDLHNCLLDLSNMTELIYLNMDEVTLSSSCCDVLGRTLTHCTKLKKLEISNTDLHNCLLNLTYVTENKVMCMSEVNKHVRDMLDLTVVQLDNITLSSNARQVLEQSIDQLIVVKEPSFNCTFQKSLCDNDKWKVNLSVDLDQPRGIGIGMKMYRIYSQSKIVANWARDLSSLDSE